MNAAGYATATPARPRLLIVACFKNTADVVNRVSPPNGGLPP